MPSGATVLADRYVLRERIGAGGMGEVWAATDQLLGRTVAVKLILPALVDEPGFVRRFLAEARAMASVQHPGVVTIHDFHGDDQSAYLVMEFVEGEPLSRLLARSGRLTPEATMGLLAQAARALQAVHDRGIVHRDIKPGNLLLRADGTLALADFGIALGSSGTALTTAGAVLGTPAYLAPEQVLGQAASPRSDVYALGVVAYECLSGTRPFVGDNPFAVAMQRVGNPPPPLPPEIPPAVAAVVGRALQPDPALRWASAAELAHAMDQARIGYVDQATSGRSVIAPTSGRNVVPPSWPGAVPAKPRRRGLLIGAIAAAVLLVAAGVGVAVWQTRPNKPGTGSVSGHKIPAGFVACGDALCPTQPLCWHGLTRIGDQVFKPGKAACTEPHYWETFAAGYLPADAGTGAELGELIDRPDIQALCSADRMAAHSSDASATTDWTRQAWPIEADAYTVLVHCLGGSPEGESLGAVFQPVK